MAHTEQELLAQIDALERERAPIATEYARWTDELKLAKKLKDKAHRSAYSKGVYVPDKSVIALNSNELKAKQNAQRLKQQLEDCNRRLRPLKTEWYENYGWRRKGSLHAAFVEVAERIIDAETITQIWSEVRQFATERCAVCNGLSPLVEMVRAGEAFYHTQCAIDLRVKYERVGPSPQQPGEYRSGASEKQRFNHEWRKSAFRQGR